MLWLNKHKKKNEIETYQMMQSTPVNSYMVRNTFSGICLIVKLLQVMSMIKFTNENVCQYNALI